MNTTATFDENDWCSSPGYATYQSRPMFRRRLRCWMGKHKLPSSPPAKPNGHSPSNYARCPRCGAFMHWFVEGQHRYGGFNRDGR